MKIGMVMAASKVLSAMIRPASAASFFITSAMMLGHSGGGGCEIKYRDDGFRRIAAANFSQQKSKRGGHNQFKERGNQ